MAETSDPISFVPYQPQKDEPARKIVTRAFHKKSRSGCQLCKARRVKCNEEHPVCSNCRKHNSVCVWPDGPLLPTPKAREDAPAEKFLGIPQPGWHKSLTVNVWHAPPLETTERRILELRLLHNWMTVTAPSLGGKCSIRTDDWKTVIPPIAFDHESLLYGMYAITALHLAHLHPEQPEHDETHQHYLCLCFRSHHDEVQDLNASNADAAMLTASILRMCSVTALRTRGLYEDGRYIPPLDWLIMNLGTGHGLGLAAWKFIQHDKTSVMRRWIIDTAPMLDPSKCDFRAEGAFDASNITPSLSQVLHRTVEDELDEPWEKVFQEAYHGAAAYIGNCQLAIAAGEPDHSIMRRLLLFPALIDREFVDLVEEQRERALTLLGHYFSLCRRCDNVWWFKGAGERELDAIRGTVSLRWKALLP